MTTAEVLFQNLLTVFILFVLAVIIYCRVTGKTLLDLFYDIKEMLSGGSEEAVDLVQGGYESIR